MDDEISQGPERDTQLPRGPRRWVTAAAVAALVAVAAVVAVTRGGAQHGAAPAPPTPARSAAPSASPAPRVTQPPGRQVVVLGGPPPALPGAIVASGSVQEVLWPQGAAAPTGAPVAALDCQSAIWGQLEPNWRAGSLRAGPLWFVAGTRLGYVRLGRGAATAGAAAGHAASRRDVDMLLHLDAGSTVVMRFAADTGRYFTFVDSAGEPLADREFILSSCPASDSHADLTDFYQLGFAIAAGHTATIQVWTGSAHPVWITLTAPAGN